MSTPIAIWDNETFDVSGITVNPGEQVILASSVPVNNAQTRFNSINVELEFHSIAPDITDGSPPFTVGAVVEAQDANGAWQIIGYQYSAFRNSQSAPKRSIRIQPNISDFNTGIDDSVFFNTELARISRQQGKVPETQVRVCLLLVDNDPQGPNAFQSIAVSAAGELFNA